MNTKENGVENGKEDGEKRKESGEVRDCNRYTDRPFNIRPLCFWAFFAGLTAAVCNFAFSQKIIWLVFVYFFVLAAVFQCLHFVKSKDRVLAYFGSSRLFFCVLLTVCLAVAFSFAFTALSYTNQKTYTGYNELSGAVESYNTREDGTGYIMLSSAKFGGSVLSGRVMVYTETALTGFKSFDRISVVTQLRNAQANEYYTNNGIRYTANIRAEADINVLWEDKSLRSVILRYSRDYFEKFLGGDNGGLMYSMLFGDKSSLDGEIQQSFRLTGLAHALAVSGLHVGLIAALLVFVLNRFGLSRRKQLYIIFAVLLFYCYLCGFRYSILRASIMFSVFLLRRVFLRSTDMLSSVSLAGILILVLFPFSLFSVSFQLSFACMFGIALFYLPFNRFFGKAVKNEWLCGSIAMYFATTVICLPLMIKYFGAVSVIGLAANVFVLFLIGISFQASVIALVTWAAFPVLYLISPVLDFVLAFAKWLANFPFAVLNIGGGGGDWFLLYLLGLVLTTRFIFTRPHFKYSAAAVLIGIYALSLILG